MSAKDNHSEYSLADQRQRLEQLLEQLESGEVPLEDVSSRLEMAAEIADDIERRLMEHKASISLLKKRFDSSQ